jgi:hypothetical protein
MSRFLSVLLLSCGVHCTLAQGFIPPSSGQAVIYFVRHSPYQASTPFEVFHGDRFIADFPGKNYYRYECPPGKHVFWVSAENKAFIEADVKAGASYIIVIEPRAGASAAQVVLTPMHGRLKEFHKSKWIIMNKASVIELPETLEAENQRMANFIRNTLSGTDLSAIQNKLTADMFIDVERMLEKDKDIEEKKNAGRK